MKNYLKEIFLILIFCLLNNYVFSQEIQSIYKFKKHERKRHFKDYELDSLVLYKNGTFYRKRHLSNFDIVDFSEIKGNWKLSNNIISFEITEEKHTLDQIEWEKSNGKYRYTFKRKRIIPINDNFDIFAIRKLKLVK